MKFEAAQIHTKFQTVQIPIKLDLELGLTSQSTAMVMSRQSIYLTLFFPGQSWPHDSVSG